MSSYLKVRNMESPRTGQPVANQFIIRGDDGTLTFQSYRTTIATEDAHGRVTLDDGALDYSVTTSKYLYRFLDADRKQVKARIADGTYAVADLNP